MNLKHTLTCGQFFRYKEHSEGFLIQSRNEVFFVDEASDFSQQRLAEFFALDVKPKLPEDKLLQEVKTDLRIIKQDPWECLIGFVCSAASNIPRIQKNLDLLSKEFGAQIEFEGKIYYAFPEVGSFNDLERIKNCGVGFRAKYIHEINKMVDEAFFEELKTLPYQKAKQKLIALPGVGEKIADCVCLYSLQHYESFPLDVWMKRIVKEHYGKEGTYEEISAWAREYFGEYAGFAQQYLYHWKRNLSKS